MTIQKTTEELSPQGGPRRLPARPGDTASMPQQQIDLLTLELEEDSGGDPYNRTGQFCLAELKKRDS